MAWKIFDDREEQSLQNQESQSSRDELLGQGLNMAQLKIGKYKVDSIQKDGKAWEELKFEGVEEVSSANLYEDFSKLYPRSTDKNSEMYIRNLLVRGDTIEVSFGGDETKLTERMGTTGALLYAGELVFTLTEDPKINLVDFKLQKEGSHFGPGTRTRENFMDLWPTGLLEKHADQGNQEAKRILNYR
ncbi:MAG: hypothetical protein HYV77_02795 [Candidatus Wildermuthbacteria bacterium]|nr:hypothetical protein [Candidatus Wildermuthbacteria bacterium]